jgi:hypothetical protein
MSGNEYLFFCPKCNHHRRKLSINLKKDCWKCWVCDYSGFKLHRLVRRWGSSFNKKNWSEIDSAIDAGSYNIIFREWFENDKRECEQRISLPPEFKTLVTNDFKNESLEARSYLRSRGLSFEEIIKWKIGYCVSGDYSDRIIIPSFNLNGHTDFFVGRTFKREWPFYSMPSVNKDIVFNSLFVDWTSDLFLVEGVFDAIRAGNAVPILGSSLREESKLFQAIAMHDTPIYLALDADAEKKAMKLIYAMMQYEIEIFKVDTSGFKDIAEMPLNILEKRKSESILMNNNSFYKYRIMNL